MKKILHKVWQILGTTAIVCAIAAIQIAYGATPQIASVNSGNSLNLKSIIIQSAQNVLLNIGNNNNNNLPVSFDYNPGPVLGPDRACILHVPEVYDGNGIFQEIRGDWYWDIMSAFPGQYVLPAQDPDGDGWFEPVDAAGNYDLSGDLTPAVPYNSFNNFCFDSTQPAPLDLYVGNENGQGADKHFYSPVDSTDQDDIILTYNDNKVVDERRFLTVTHCEDPDPTTPENEAYDANPFTCDGQFLSLDDYYAMEDEADVEPGDIVRFGVYVHNNSIYPSDPNALATNIEIEFDTQTFTNNPRAYVSATENQYHEDPFDQSSAVIGNNTMFDRTTLNSTTPAFTLTPIENRAWIYNEEVSEGQSSGNHLPEPIGATYNYNMTEFGEYNLNMSVSSSIVNGEHQLTVNQQAGCFEFANWYFFDYRIEEEEAACDELDIFWMRNWPTYEALPVLRDEFIDPALADPPIPVSFSDTTDEGLYIIGDPDVPLLVQINRNGYEEDLVWELLIVDGAGNLVPYQTNVEHFCSNVAVGTQQNNCNFGTVLSDSDAGTDFSRITTNPNSLLGSAYQQDTFKLYNLGREVVLHIYATVQDGKTGICDEAVYMPICQDMTLVSPAVDTTTGISLDPFDNTTGVVVEVDTIPDYYNGPIVFSTDNVCGVFDNDIADLDFTNDTNPIGPDANGFYSTQFVYGVSDPKSVRYGINTSEPGCSGAIGDFDTIRIHLPEDKGRCDQELTFPQPEIPACIEVDLTSDDTYIDDSTPDIQADVEITADAGWVGTVQIWVCQDTSNLLNCILSLDPTATVNGAPQPAIISGVQNGDVLPITVENISNPPQSIFVNTIGTLICNASIPVEWCGDGIVYDGNDGIPNTDDDGEEECDDGNNTNGDGCNEFCEIEPEDILCENLEIVAPANLSCDALPEQVVTSITPPGWTGDIFWSSPDPVTTFDTDPSCSSPSSTLITTADGLGNGLSVYVCSCDYSADIDVSVIGTPAEEAACNDSITTEEDPGFCGDGILDPDGIDDIPGTPDDELCDDGNNINGDGCDEFCQPEPGTEFCGDGILDPDGVDNIPGTPDDEFCDDGNNIPGDGCDEFCQVEEDPGFCGDGILDPDGIDDIPGNADDEFCDDGNNINGDGCDEFCQVEEDPGFCGDGTLDPDGIDDIPGNADDEFCDDGNNINGDGCDEFCQVEEDPGFCGDGILDPDGEDDIPGTPDDEFCDDGILDGTVCNADCTTPGGGGDTGDDSICYDLEITTPSSGNVTSFPVLIRIETDPSNWADQNGATFNYSGPGLFEDIANPGVWVPGLLNTQSKSVLYSGDVGHTVSVSDSVFFASCNDSITFTEDDIPPGEEDPDDDTDGDGGDGNGGDGGDGNGGDGDDGGGGGSCPGIDIITPNPKTLTEAHGYMEIISYDGANNYNGPFKYHSADGNVKFIDLLANNGAGAIAVSNDLADGVLDGDALNLGEYILGEEPNTTDSKEVYYYVVDAAGNPVETMEEGVTIFVEDMNEPLDPFCGDNIQNSLAEPLGPQLEKFGWIHPTGGNTTNQEDYDVNYQITYYNYGSDITSIQITDTIAENLSPAGEAAIYGDNATLNDYIEWSPTNDEPAAGLVNLNTNPAAEPGVDTWYYGIGMHWIQTGDEHATWGGHDIQIPACDEELETYAAPVLEEGETPPPPPTNLEAGILCYEGRIDELSGVTVHNMNEDTIFRFEYEGIFHAQNFFDQCNGPSSPVLEESFFNEAVGTPLDGTPPDYAIRDTETLNAVCNYSLTRNAGDVLFFNNAEPGANLALLPEENTRNSDGLVLIRRAIASVIENIWGGGINGDITPSFCDNLDYNNEMPHLFSSFICEAYYDEDAVNPEWNPGVIEEQTDLSYLEGYEFSGTQTISDLDPMGQLAQYLVGDPTTNLEATRGKVFKFQGNQLKIGTPDAGPGVAPPIQIPANSGAMTVFVEGDLKIYQDIVYADDESSPDHEVTSIAFIVEGDIYIHPDVKEVSGVFIAKPNDDGNGGMFKNTEVFTTSPYQLVIRGSVFGDLQEIIDERTFIGAPILDGGNVVIRYDNRVMRNTPPGLRDEINLEWLRTGRQPLGQ